MAQSFSQADCLAERSGLEAVRLTYSSGSRLCFAKDVSFLRVDYGPVQAVLSGVREDLRSGDAKIRMQRRAGTMIGLATKSTSGTSARDGESNASRNQHNRDDGRDMLTMSSLNSQVGASDLDALPLGVRNGNDQRRNAEDNQEQAHNQQHLHRNSSLIDISKKFCNG
jgi:hypothetical protein